MAADWEEQKDEHGDGQGGIPWFTEEDLSRFGECLTGDPQRDQHCFRTLLATVSEVLGETELDTLLVKLLDRVIQTTQSERGIIILTDSEGSPRVRLARDKSGRDLGKRPKISRKVPQSVLDEGKPVLARVSREGDVLDLTQSMVGMRLRQVMCAPLRVRRHTQGVIYVDSTVTGPPQTVSDLMLFHTQAGLMAMAIDHHLLLREAMQSRAMAEQLRVAHDIQQSLLPPSSMKLSGIELAGMSEPFKRVGGDYFDYFPVDVDRTGLVVGDVSGQGIPGALVMSNVRSHLRTLIEMRRALGGLYGLMNRALCSELVDGMFVSLFVAVFDRERMLLEYQNAGHPPPLLYRPEEDSFREIPSTAAALGIQAEISAGPCPSVQVQPGEFLFCYTDGITEMPNRARELFEVERLKEAVRNAVKHYGDCTGVVKGVYETLEAYSKGVRKRDDVTMLVARFL